MARLNRSPQDDAQSGITGLVVSESDLNPILQIVTWILLATTTLMLTFRLLTRFFLRSQRTPGLEDILILVSYVFSVGESVTMLVPESKALGRDQHSLTAAEIEAKIKAEYARDLLFILTLGMAKWSVNASLQVLSPGKHGRVTSLLGIAITIWMVSSFFGIAFQCGGQGPWNSENAECIDQRALLEYVIITNIIIDAALMVIPVVVVWPLKMALRSRLTIISFFWSRSLAIVATVCQLAYLPRLYANNSTLRAFPYYLSMQFVLFTSISTACVVYFLPLFRSLQSGLLWANSTTHASSYSLFTTAQGTKERTNNQREFNETRYGNHGADHEIALEISVNWETRSHQVDPFRPNW